MLPSCHALPPPTPPQARGAAGRTSLYLPYLPISPYTSLYLPIPQARGAAGRPEAEALGGLGRTLRDTELLGQSAPLGRSSRLRRWDAGRETPTRSPTAWTRLYYPALERLTMRLAETGRWPRGPHKSVTTRSTFLDAL